MADNAMSLRVTFSPYLRGWARFSPQDPIDLINGQDVARLSTTEPTTHRSLRYAGSSVVVA
jgi:hypothetical protein